ncbi:MAG: glycosyltransferase [Thaumarchaeota archaeon]|nr:glycosyltransferase [Nitrososphaerota archaeon]
MEPKRNNSSTPLVSVVVTTKNSEETLNRCLESVVNQTYKNRGQIEIITVDNHSTDATQDIARRFGSLYVKGPERTAQANYGAKMSNGKYLYWIGSDWIIEPTLIEEAVSKSETNGYDAIAVHNSSDPTVSFWSQVRKFERDFYSTDPLVLTPSFFRRDVYMRIGGLDESLVACEEYEIHRRLIKGGYKIGRIHAKEVHLGEPKSLKEIVIKHYYYGKTLPAYVKSDSNDAVKRLSPIRISFVHNLNRFGSDPRLLSGFLIYNFVRYASAGLGYLTAVG